MISAMNKLVWGIVGVLLAAASPLRAETVSFPEDEPVFKIDVPEGWAAKNESETALYLRPTSGTTGHFFAFLEVPAGEVSDEASATKYLESYRGKDLETLGVNVKDSMLFPVIEEA